MAQGSAPTARVVRVLEALRGHGPPGLRYAELADAAAVSQATCHAILTTLVEAGYVVRDPAEKTFALGPGLVALGEAASHSHPELTLARAELEALAAATGLRWSAGKAVDDEIRILAVGGTDTAGDPVRPGASLPLVPPFGAIHLAWSPDEMVERWIARAPGRTFSPRELRAVIRDHRRSRYAVAPYTPASAQLREALTELATDEVSDDVRARSAELLAAIDRLDYRADDLRNGRPLSVNTITAPVFDRDAAVAFVVALHVAEPELRAANVRGLARQLLQTVDRVTRVTGGRIPEDEPSASRGS